MPSKRIYNRLPARYREQLRHFIEDGARPDDKRLVALLSGRYDYVVSDIDDDLGDVIAFLKKYCPDFAYGTPYEVARWEMIQSALAKSGETCNGD